MILLFSKIDLSAASNKILKDEKTQKDLTLSNHKRIFSTTRFLYGNNNASSNFYKILWKKEL